MCGKFHRRRLKICGCPREPGTQFFRRKPRCDHAWPRSCAVCWWPVRWRPSRRLPQGLRPLRCLPISVRARCRCCLLPRAVCSTYDESCFAPAGAGGSGAAAGTDMPQRGSRRHGTHARRSPPLLAAFPGGARGTGRAQSSEGIVRCHVLHCHPSPGAQSFDGAACTGHAVHSQTRIIAIKYGHGRAPPAVNWLRPPTR